MASLENISGKPLTLSLEKRYREVPRTLTWATGETKAGLPDALLEDRYVVAAIDAGQLSDAGVYDTSVGSRVVQAEMAAAIAAAAGGGAEVASGVATMDGTASQSVVTGLTVPISMVFVALYDIAEVPLPGESAQGQWVVKTKEMPGREAFGVWRRISDTGAGAGLAIGPQVDDGIGFINAGKDFDVLNSDGWAFNDFTGFKLYWVAIGV